MSSILIFKYIISIKEKTCIKIIILYNEKLIWVFSRYFLVNLYIFNFVYYLYA
jgi:hypothetical protein